MTLIGGSALFAVKKWKQEQLKTETYVTFAHVAVTRRNSKEMSMSTISGHLTITQWDIYAWIIIYLLYLISVRLREIHGEEKK